MTTRYEVIVLGLSRYIHYIQCTILATSDKRLTYWYVRRLSDAKIRRAWIGYLYFFYKLRYANVYPI